MAKISELTTEQIEKQLRIIKKAITNGDDSKKKIFAALMKEYKSRKASTQEKAPEKKVVTKSTDEKKAPVKKVETEDTEEKKPAKKGKKKFGKPKASIKGKSSSRNPRVSGRNKEVKKGKPERKSGSKSKGKSAEGDKTALGKVRKPLNVIIFSIITFGIYSFVYFFKTFNELKNYRGQGMSGIVVLLLSLFTPVGIIFPWLLPSYIGKLYSEEEQESPVKGLTGCWVLLPIIGGFIWTFKVQGALNTFWQEKIGPEDDSDENDDEEDVIEEEEDDDDLIEEEDDDK